MKKTLVIALSMIALAVGVIVHRKMDDVAVRTNVSNSDSHSAGHPTSTSSVRVPTYQTLADVQTLGSTLEPSKFMGKTREAYKVAKEIPETLAQLPCYCHCDQGFGHKSLHSCFEDDHAAHCAVCVDEALLAYQLEKEHRLAPEQVRKIIIEKYSAQN